MLLGMFFLIFFNSFFQNIHCTSGINDGCIVISKNVIAPRIKIQIKCKGRKTHQLVWSCLHWNRSGIGMISEMSGPESFARKPKFDLLDTNWKVFLIILPYFVSVFHNNFTTLRAIALSSLKEDLWYTNMKCNSVSLNLASYAAQVN